MKQRGEGGGECVSYDASNAINVACLNRRLPKFDFYIKYIDPCDRLPVTLTHRSQKVFQKT